MDIFRVTSTLLNQIRADLRRPHMFASERMGFVFCRAATVTNGMLVLAEDYEPVADENYVPDRSVGARMNSAAIRAAMQRSLMTSCGLFHVHLHDWCGEPSQSTTDRRESKKFVPDFFNVCPTMPHGAIILSNDSLAGWCWTSKKAEPARFRQIEIVGVPLRLVGFGK